MYNRDFHIKIYNVRGRKDAFYLQSKDSYK